ASAALTYGAPTTFATLEVSTPGKTIAFDHVEQTTIASLVAVGTSCSSGQVAIQSTSAGVRFPLAVATADVRHVTLRDAGAATALLASGSVDLGNNDADWTIGECIQVSGIATTDQAGTPWTTANGGGCDGVTPNVSVSWDGEDKRTATCNATTGAWTVEVGVGQADTPLVVYLDTAGGDRAATYTRTANTSSDISGLTVTRDRVRVRSESTSAVTHREIARYDGAMDPDLPATAPAGALVIPSSVELLVEVGDTYRPTGDVRVGALQVDGTFIGGQYTVTLSGSGTNASCSSAPGTQMPLCVTGGATFDASASTIFAGTSASHVAGTTYEALAIAPEGAGAPTIQLGSAASQAITATSFTVGNGTDPVTASTTTFAPSTTINGPVTVAAGGTLSGSGAGAFLTTGAVTGAGTINLPAAPFEQRIAGESRFGQTAGASAWTLGDLTFSNSAGTAYGTTLSSGGTGAIVVAGTLAVGTAGDAAATTLDAARFDRAIDANGAVSITTSGVLRAPPTAAFTVAGDFTNDGTFTHGGGLVTIDGTGTSNLAYAAATSFHNLRVATASKVVRFDHVEQTNVVGTTGTHPGLTVDGGACGTLVGLRSTLGGDQAALNVTGSSNIAYAEIQDSNAIAALTATNSTNGGNATGWTIGPCAASITLLVTAGDSPDFTVLPGADATSQSTVHVETAAPTGYSLLASDLSDTAGLTRAGGGTVDDWTGTEAAPSVWTPGDNGTNGYFGVSVLSATSGRIAKWGVGAGAEGDLAANRYMGLRTTARELHATTGAAVDDVVVAYRANPHGNNPAGTYTTTINVTAVINP
ncbi:MAG: hypothetical protein JWM25_1769, partial [Thermoleophilia bacterium]|nr:hypothetical protein [Thermoleophilia bacterium]